MEAVIKTPMDYQESLVFRRLAAFFSKDAPDVVKASFVYHGIFRDLAYMAREGRDPGRVTPDDVSLFHKILSTVTPDADALWASLTGSGEQPIRMFIPDGPDFVCRPFADKNTHLGPNAMQTRESRGGVMRAFYALEKKARSVEYQMHLNISEDRLRDLENNPLDAEMTRRVKWLVTCVDGALKQPARAAGFYSADLIQNAAGILKRYADEEAYEVIKYIAENRDDQALKGHKAEKILTLFDEIRATMKG